MGNLTNQEQRVLEIVEEFNEAIYEQGNLDRADELIADDFRHHAPFPTPQGLEGFKQFLSQFQQAFPDSTSGAEEFIVDGNKVAVRYTMRGTHRGEFMDIPATGRNVELQGISIYRVEDGKVAEEWAQPDLMTMLQQLGVAPETG